MNMRAGIGCLAGLLLAACNELPDDLRTPDDIGSFTYISSGLTSKDIQVIFEDRSGKIWVGTGDGIGRLDGERFTLFDTGDGLFPGGYRAVTQTADGDIWFGGDYGISIFNGNSFVNLETETVVSLLSDSGQNIWIGTWGGLYLIDPDGQVFFLGDEACEPCNYVDEIREDSDGNIWFGTWGGAFRFNGTQFTKFDSSNGLSDDYVQAVAEDRMGRVWLGHYLSDQISIYNGGSFEQETNPGASNDVLSLSAAGKNMYIGTWGGGVLIHDGVVVRPVKLPRSDDYIHHILTDSKGYIWIGTSENGLIRHIPKP